KNLIVYYNMETNTNTKLTFEMLNDNDSSVFENIKFAETFKPIYVDRPKKPILNQKHSTEEVLQYALFSQFP
ncbi:MAG: hypothetical protein AABY05_00865, partial [Nanoarchaeota archaeon]